MTDELSDYLLKECYEISERFEPMENAKMILREKRGGITLTNGVVPQDMSIGSTQSFMQTVSEVTYELAMEGLDDRVNREFSQKHAVENMPDCAEKQYILALLELRNGTYETQRISALRYLKEALSKEPNDPRFIALAQVLSEA